MADPKVKEPEGYFTGVAGSTDVSAGDLVYFDGTDWELADASDNTKFAEALVILNASAGETIGLCTSGIVVDTDAPYTQGDQYYLSETAGAITATRPTTAQSLRQMVAFGLSTSELRVEVYMPREMTLNYNFVNNQNVAQGVQIDTAGCPDGDFISVAMDAQNEDAGVTFGCPQNFVALEIAYLYLVAEATCGTPTFDAFVSGEADGAQWDNTTVDATLANQVGEGSAADQIHRIDFSTAFDAAGILEPDNCVGMRLTKDDAGTDITLFLCLSMVWLVV